MKASDRFSAGPVQATCTCCGRVYEVLNLSLGGIFIETKRVLRPSTPLTLKLALPGWERPVLVPARVVRLDKTKDGSFNSVAIQLEEQKS